MAIEKLVNGIKKGVGGLALGTALVLGSYGVSGCGTDGNGLHFWYVDQCLQGVEDFYETEDGFCSTSGFCWTRDFSYDDLCLEEKDNTERYEQVRCALSLNPDLYVFKDSENTTDSCEEGDIILDLVLLKEEPFPGTIKCREQEWTKEWYKQCFPDEYNEYINEN